MNLTLTGEAEAAIERLMGSGKFQNPPEIVQIALRTLEQAASNSVPTRPEGYFSSDYGGADEERVALEQAMSTITVGPER